MTHSEKFALKKEEKKRSEVFILFSIIPSFVFVDKTNVSLACLKP